MAEITNDQVKCMVHRYLTESGCVEAASHFEREAGLNNLNVEVPQEDLTICVKKGVLQVQLESQPKYGDFADGDVKILTGHKSQVIACAWSPDGRLLVSGSQHRKGIIWDVNEQASQASPVAILHYPHSLSAICWNAYGTLLATGGNSTATLYKPNGNFIRTFRTSGGIINCIQWGRELNNFAVGHANGSVELWSQEGKCLSNMHYHTDIILSMDWGSSTMLATGSKDHLIKICRLRRKEPLQTFIGHEGDVNTVLWNASSDRLASCSADHSIKLWQLKQEDRLLLDLQEHHGAVSAIKWNPTHHSMLASSSFDSTVKIWNMEEGTLLKSFNQHSDRVHTIAFSPSGDYLASGSLDKKICIWSVGEGVLVKTFTGKAGIRDLSWNRDGDKIAACFYGKPPCVIDFRV